MRDLNKYIVQNINSIRQAIKSMDEGGIGFCVCVNSKEKVIGVLTDGDFRRAVLSEVSLDKPVENIINKDFISVQKDHNENEIRELFTDSIVQHIPVLDGDVLIDIYTEEVFFGIDSRLSQTNLDNPVVIMAGGMGKRMDPFTRILPKPLIPIGNDPVIKVIMDEFSKNGLNHFLISLNSKGRMIKAYFSEHELSYDIQYIEEDKPLGTAGALKYLTGKFKIPFFVSNCDIIIRTDYGAIMDFHIKGNYDLTLVASMRHYVIPYGVCEVNGDGVLKEIQEKPEYDLLVNTGLYIIQPEILKYIPDSKYFDMPDLIKLVQENNLKVGVFPISEKSWSDVGQWEEYNETFKTFIK